MKKTLQQIVAARVQMHRTLLNLTQAELATKAGVSQSTIAQVESARKSGSLETIERLAKALEISPATLLTPGKLTVTEAKVG